MMSLYANANAITLLVFGIDTLTVIVYAYMICQLLDLALTMMVFCGKMQSGVFFDVIHKVMDL
jgi:hypothetical protein